MNIQKQLAQAATFAKSSAVLICLLGVTWIVGVLYVSKGTRFFAYAFTVLNSLQGFFVFIFHCILNEKVRYESRGVWVSPADALHFLRKTHAPC